MVEAAGFKAITAFRQIYFALGAFSLSISAKLSSADRVNPNTYSNPTMNWYYVEQGQQTGPVNDNQMAELLRTGRINADTLVWYEGLAEWQPFNQVRSELKPSVPPLMAGSTSPGGPANFPSGVNEAVCAECGKMFPVDEMIRHGSAYICAGCKPVFMQKLAEGAPILAPGELRYAGFWIRVVAKILDILILVVPFLVIFAFVMAAMIPSARTHGTTPTFPLIFQGFLQLSFVFICVAYYVFFLGKYGATPGKMACKLKVVTSDGAKISYGRATGRYFSEIISGITCDIGYIIAAFDNPQKRALHDHICNTRVVYK